MDALARCAVYIWFGGRGGTPQFKRFSKPIMVIIEKISYEPRHEKTNILHMRKKKTQISFAVTAKLISAFVFAS